MPDGVRCEPNPFMSFQANTLTFCWTATGDDGLVGIASHYDIRYSINPPGTDTVAWWNSCTRATNEPPPVGAGIRQCMTVANIDNNQNYYAAMKAADEAGNWSGLSNIASTIFDYYYCADVDGDGMFSILDILYLVNFIFKEGPAPIQGDGNVDGNDTTNILDIIYMIKYRFYIGPNPICQ